MALDCRRLRNENNIRGKCRESISLLSHQIAPQETASPCEHLPAVRRLRNSSTGETIAAVQTMSDAGNGGRNSEQPSARKRACAPRTLRDWSSDVEREFPPVPRFTDAADLIHHANRINKML